jgi:hypothetical protein
LAHQIRWRRTQTAEHGGEEQPQGHPKRVTYNRYDERARLDERVRLIGEALREDQTQQVVDDDPPPDKMQNVFEYMEWQDRQGEPPPDVAMSLRPARKSVTKSPPPEKSCITLAGQPGYQVGICRDSHKQCRS